MTSLRIVIPIAFVFAVLGVFVLVRSKKPAEPLFKALTGPSEGNLLTDVPDILSESAPDFCDLVFKVKMVENQKTDAMGFGAGALYKGQGVGFNIWLLGPWERWRP